MEDGLTAPLMSQMLGAEHLQFPWALIQGIHLRQRVVLKWGKQTLHLYTYTVCVYYCGERVIFRLAGTAMKFPDGARYCWHQWCQVKEGWMHEILEERNRRLFPSDTPIAPAPLLDSKLGQILRKTPRIPGKKNTLPLFYATVSSCKSQVGEMPQKH